MILNPDCIRDILIYIESKTDSKITSVGFKQLVDSLDSYDKNTLYYHVNQISKSNLVDNVFYADNAPLYISDLTPEGHEFLANIRSNSNWNKTKEVAKKVGSFSLDTLKEISANVISKLIESQFH